MIKVTTQKLKLSQIRVNPDNPRTITEKDMELLIKSLREFPEMMELREIVVDENMMILGGNMRYRALEKLSDKEYFAQITKDLKAERKTALEKFIREGCVAKIVTGLTPEQKEEFIIKDNAAYGAWDWDALANFWSDKPLGAWGVGVPRDWLGKPPEGGGGEPKEARPPQIVTCPKCGHEFTILEKKE